MLIGINYQNSNEHQFSVGCEHHRRQNSATYLLARKPQQDLKFETVQGRGGFITPKMLWVQYHSQPIFSKTHNLRHTKKIQRGGHFCVYLSTAL